MKKIGILLSFILSFLVINIDILEVKATGKNNKEDADKTLYCVYEIADTEYGVEGALIEKTFDARTQSYYSSRYVYALVDITNTDGPGDEDRVIILSNPAFQLDGSITFYDRSVENSNKDYFPYIKDVSKCPDSLYYYKATGYNSVGIWESNEFWILRNESEDTKEYNKFIDDEVCAKCTFNDREFKQYKLKYYWATPFKNDSDKAKRDLGIIANNIDYNDVLDRIESNAELKEKFHEFPEPTNPTNPEPTNPTNPDPTEPTVPEILPTDDGYACAVDHRDDAACGSVYFIPPQLPFLTSLLMDLIKIFVPIALIIKGLIDLFKAITGANDKEIEKARGKFFKRLIPAVAVFLIVLLVQFIFGIIATDSENNTFLACTNCFLNNNCSKTSQEMIVNYCKDMKYDPTNITINPKGGATNTNTSNNTPVSTGVNKNNCQEVNVFNTITVEQAKSELASALAVETTSRGKAVAAANYLATNFPSLPYFWGGHAKEGINSKWGTCDMKTADVEGHSTRNTYQPYGMDCSGYVTWAMWQAGYKGEYKTANSWGTITAKKYEITGQSSAYVEGLGAKVGDLVWHNNHIGIIIGKDSKGFIIAHEKGSAYGLTKEYLDDNISPNGKKFTYVLLMDDFYNQF